MKIMAKGASFHATDVSSARSGRRSVTQSLPSGHRVAPLRQQLLQRKPDTCACGGGCPRCQAKSNGLKVSQPNDPAEIEADRIADHVMRMADPGVEGTERVGRYSRSPGLTIHRQEAEPASDEQRNGVPRFLRCDFDLRLDWFEMTRPFYTRGAESLLFFDDRMYDSIGHVWTNNYRFFVNVGLGDSLSADAANFFTPFTIDLALKRDYATASELFERNADITSIMISPTLFHFDIHDIPGTLRFPFLKMFGVDQPNPYAPPGGGR